MNRSAIVIPNIITHKLSEENILINRKIFQKIFK